MRMTPLGAPQRSAVRRRGRRGADARGAGWRGAARPVGWHPRAASGQAPPPAPLARAAAPAARAGAPWQAFRRNGRAGPPRPCPTGFPRTAAWRCAPSRAASGRLSDSSASASTASRDRTVRKGWAKEARALRMADHFHAARAKSITLRRVQAVVMLDGRFSRVNTVFRMRKDTR